MNQTKNNDNEKAKELINIGETRAGRTTYDICCAFADKGKTFEERLLSLAKKEKFD